MSTLISEPRVDEPATGTRESWLINPQLPAASCVPEEGTGAYELLHRYDVGPLRQERIPRSYFKMDAHHVQFNVVRAETLRKAQQNPDQYRDLIVRVAGFSDYFCDISRELQEEIIARTEHQAM